MKLIVNIFLYLQEKLEEAPYNNEGWWFAAIIIFSIVLVGLIIACFSSAPILTGFGISYLIYRDRDLLTPYISEFKQFCSDKDSKDK